MNKFNWIYEIDWNLYNIIALVISIMFGMMVFITVYSLVGLLFTPFIKWIEKKLLGGNLNVRII